MTKKDILNRIKDITGRRIPNGYIDEESANSTLQRVAEMLRGILIDCEESPDK